MVIENGGICQNCYIKFNEFDEHQSKANQILSDLTSMLSIRENYVDIKEEDDDCDTKVQSIEYTTEFDDTATTNAVEISNEYEISMGQEVITEDDFTIEEVKDELNIIKSKNTMSQMKAVNRGDERKRSNYIKKDRDKGFIITMINNVKHYTCEFCNKNFLSRARLRSHRQIHSTERNFICQECGAKFKTLNCLKNHARLHSNVFFQCDMCESRFKGEHEF